MTFWTKFLPELYTLLTAVIFLFLSLGKPNRNRDFQLALILAAIGLIVCIASVGQHGTLFGGTYRVDLFSQIFKILIYIGFFLILCLCGNLNGVDEKWHTEFYLLMSICTMAMMLLTSCVHLLTLYLALELSSYSLYIMVYLRKGFKYGIEAGIKYFFVGATASVIMLLGFALLYSQSRSMYLADLARELPNLIHLPVALFGFMLALSGFLFKLAAFPFHFWAPDVYEGAPHQAAGYIASVSKVAAIAVLVRLVSLAGGNQHLAYFLIVLSLISMTVGNLAAVAQKDLKRLLAFSSVAHAGYVLIGILSMNILGYISAVFYALSLLVMKFTCFMTVVKASDNGRNLTIDQLAGLHKRAPMLALALMLALFSLAGIPPTIGFTSKLMVFTAAIRNGYFFLVLLAMFNVVISLYYYLKVLRAAYFLTPDSTAPAIVLSPALKLLLLGLIILMVVGGLYPRYFIVIAEAMTKSLI